MRLAATAGMAGLLMCLSSGCNSVTGTDGSQANQALPGDAQGSLGQDFGLADNSTADGSGPIDPVAVNPVRPVGAFARPPVSTGQGDPSIGADTMFGMDFGGEEAVPETVEPGTDAGVLGTGDTMFTASLINAWTFPFFEAALMADELSLLTDGLTIDLLSPSPPLSTGPPSGTFTRLERLCIASGELEFICRQRYGR